MFEVDECRPEPTAALLGWLVKHGVALPTMAAIFGRSVDIVQQELLEIHLPLPPANPNLNGRRDGLSDHGGGYQVVLAPEHPYPDNKGKYVFLHRLVFEAEMLGGRYLKPEEQIHHKNGITDCNRASNLEVTSVGEHFRIHKEIPVTEEARTEIIRLYKSGESMPRIVKKFPHIGGTRKVRKILIEAGEQVRGQHDHNYDYLEGNKYASVNKGKRKRAKYPHLEDVEWLRHMYVVLCQTDREIAPVVTQLDGRNCAGVTVWQARVRHEIPSRPRGKIRKGS
jgi:hypothetical protein